MRVQRLAAPEANVAGLQLKAESRVGACKVSVAVRELLPNVAVIVADCVVAIVPAVTPKVAELAPAAIVTEAGVVSRVLLSESDTTAPPLGAVLLSVTVHVLAAPESNVVALHDSPESSTGICNANTVETELVPRDVVMVTF